MLTKLSRIFVAGQEGMVGSAVVRSLERSGYSELVNVDRRHVDLTSQKETEKLFHKVQPEAVIICAAKVGGIHANNTYPADFIYQNLMIEANCIHQALKNQVERLIFLGSSCIYPKFAEQPMREDALLSGPLEQTNEAYAVAKIAGIKLCESYNRQYGTDFRSLMPTNLYGRGDNFHPLNSHVIPALLARFHEAKCSHSQSATIWGSGNARREFLHVDDLANAVVYCLEIPEGSYNATANPQCSHLNVGTGQDVTIAELAGLIAAAVGYEGELKFDSSQPDGTPQKLLDTSAINQLGWSPTISLENGINDTYQWFLANVESVRTE